MKNLPEDTFHEIVEDQDFHIRDLTIPPFSIPHDAAQQVVDMVLVAGVGFVLGREERPQIGGRHFARLGRHPLRDVRRG